MSTKFITDFSFDIPNLVARLGKQFAKIEAGNLTPEDADDELFR